MTGHGKTIYLARNEYKTTDSKTKRGKSFMDDKRRFFQNELSKEIRVDGMELTLIANQTGEDEWQLSVVNNYGVFTNWTDFFPTAQQAINRALNAIMEEGIEEFMGYDNFGYFYNEKYV